MYLKSKNISYLPINECAAIYIDDDESLKKLGIELQSAEIIAVDLEHHDYRSYQGFTCLIQISTVHRDYIIDALKLRHCIHLLNESFTNPNLIKVFHGAEMDIQWLQRDFGVYVVNMFDTFHASHVLEMSKHSLSFILETFCGITVDKKHQRSDWRIRPLPKDMIEYAQTDTHYLIFVYENMKNQLLDIGKSALKDVLDRSAETSLKKYEKVVYDVEGTDKSSSWKSIANKSMDVLNDENIAILRELHGWRDHVARKEDESPRYVLPRFMLVTLARIEPITALDVMATCIPTPPLLRKYAQEIAEIIEHTISAFRLEANIKELQKNEQIQQPSLRSENQGSNSFLAKTERKIVYKIQPKIAKQSELLRNTAAVSKRNDDKTWTLEKVATTSVLPTAVTNRISKFLSVRDTLVGIKRKRTETEEDAEQHASQDTRNLPLQKKAKGKEVASTSKKRQVSQEDETSEELQETSIQNKKKKKKTGREIAVNMEMPKKMEITKKPTNSNLEQIKPFDYSKAKLELKVEEAASKNPFDSFKDHTPTVLILIIRISRKRIQGKVEQCLLKSRIQFFNPSFLI